MKKLIFILILVACQASATVEDPNIGSTPTTGSSWPAPSLPSLPTSPSTISSTICSAIQGCLIVSVELTGPVSGSDKEYVAQGKVLEYIISVKNDGPYEVEAELGISPENFSPGWLSWTTKSLKIPGDSSRTETLVVKPDMNAPAGEYKFKIDASAKCSQSGSASASFKVQDYDYASETMVSGTGQFQISKDVRSMNSGIKSNKDVFFSGSVDALVKNEYLVDQAKGRSPNFEEQDAVDNYLALQPGDALFGTEEFRSSLVFGGVGAKVLESYNVQQMEFKSQDFNLHLTGSLKKMAEFRTADNFTGYYLIDAKQTRPGEKSLKEREEYLGSFEINRRILFRDRTTFDPLCFEGNCVNSPSPPSSSFASPCLSSSCGNFVNRLNTFTSSA